MSEQLENTQPETTEVETAPVETKVPESNLQDGINGGKVVLPNGTELSYTRSKESNLYTDKLKMLVKSLRNIPCLPTEVLFKEQDPEALALTRKYVEGIAKIVEVIAKHGGHSDLPSYSFRLSHLMHLNDWLNVVVRLQFATSLKVILDTLNANLSSDAKHQWGVLEVDDDGNYLINDEVLVKGALIDVFTTDEKVLSKVIFNDHSVLNCKNIDGESAPVFHYSQQDIELLSSEDLAKRAQGGVKTLSEHLLGVDAWSFLQGVLYRISDDEEEVIDITTDIFSKLDYDPAIKIKDYTELATRLSTDELPYGLHVSLLAALRDYYCKNAKVFYSFKENIEQLYTDPVSFRKLINLDPYVKTIPQGSFVITGLPDLLRLIDGNSKVLRVKLVKADGTLVDAVTITRPFTLPTYGSFNRFNPQPVLFQRIEFTDKHKPNGFMKRLSDKVLNKTPTKIDRDRFTLTDETISSADIIGFIHVDSKAYYFAEDSSMEKDDKFAMYHALNKKFKRINKGME